MKVSMWEWEMKVRVVLLYLADHVCLGGVMLSCTDLL